MATLVLLANYDIDSSQPISILLAAAPNDKSLNMRSTTSEFIDSVSYETIALYNSPVLQANHENTSTTSLWHVLHPSINKT